MFMFVLNILCHNLLVTNRSEVWYELIECGRVRIVWVRKIHGYETTSKWRAQVSTSFSLQPTIAGFVEKVFV